MNTQSNDNTIYYLTLENILDQKILNNSIYDNMNNNYYWSNDWSKEFYIQLAYRGFISVSYKDKADFLLLPEIQFEYAILEFKDLHISKKVKRLLNKDNYTFTQNKYYNTVLQEIEKFHVDSWLTKNYLNLLLDLKEYIHPSIDFGIITSEIFCQHSQKVVAGEVGYKIGATYTSLSGFCSHEKQYNNYGNLQLVLLSKYLEENHYDFWNLGHPHMEYKNKLGAKNYSRHDFLEKWKNSISIK